MNLNCFIKIFFRYILVLPIYIALSILMTWPLATRLGHTVFGTDGDALGHIWFIWSHATGQWIGSFTTLLCAPTGLSNVHAGVQPLYDALFILPAKIFGDLVTYNAMVILSFALTAWATFLFLRSWVHDAVAAFFGGLFFGFCSPAVMQAAAGHLSFALNVFLPLFLWTLLHHRKHKNLLSECLLALVFALLTFTCDYWGYFSALLALVFFIFDLLTCPLEQRWSCLRSYARAALIILVLVGLMFHTSLTTLLTTAKASRQASGFIRDYMQLKVYCAYPWEYLLPPINHPLWGTFTEVFFRIFHHNSNVFEQSLYVGILPVSLFVVAWTLAKNKRLDKNELRYLFLFSGLLMFMLLLSMPPVFRLGSIKIPNLSRLLYPLFPMFRVYARAGIFVDLFLACIAALVLAHLRRTRANTWSALGTASLVVIFFADTWSVGSNFSERTVIPESIQWLAKQPGDVIVAEYPMIRGDEIASYRYLFWQRIHKKRLVNGATPSQQQAWDLFGQVHDLFQPDAVSALKRAGVRYVIVHTRLYAEGRIPTPLKKYFPSEIPADASASRRIPSNSLLGPVYQRLGSDLIYKLDT